jgi:hypothetical protein
LRDLGVDSLADLTATMRNGHCATSMKDLERMNALENIQVKALEKIANLKKSLPKPDSSAYCRSKQPHTSWGRY